VRYGKLSFSGDTVQLWLEGLPPNDNEVMVDFIHIQTMDDFIKAFNQTFSKVPLQDEHQEMAGGGEAGHRRAQADCGHDRRASLQRGGRSCQGHNGRGKRR
jgi:hypothetical protein